MHYSLRPQNFFTVRSFPFLDVGAVAEHTSGLGPYLQYFDKAINRPAYHDADFMYHDYAIARAGQLGLKIVLTFTNNWQDFGGMDQYVQWRQWAAAANSSMPPIAGTHDDFFSDAIIRSWYREWVEHVMRHVNVVSGVRYMDDPTIFAWELANEPRCQVRAAW
jgi:mannan endo-1,4-beta-mannosidase